MSPRFLFVGERRSLTAIKHGYTWESGRLCANTLWEALKAAGIEPLAQLFANAQEDDGSPHPELDAVARCALARGVVVVSLGKTAHEALNGLGVPHARIIHPAARGAIRKRERYQEHVRAALATEG